MKKKSELKEKKAEIVNPDKFDGKEVIENRPIEVQKSLAKEQVMESLKVLIDNIGNSDFNLTPIVVGKKNKELFVSKLVLIDGVYTLPDLDKPLVEDLETKRILVANIMKNIDTVLKKEIGEVTETALMRKDVDVLNNLNNKLSIKGQGFFHKKKKAHLRNRLGCIFLEVDDLSFQI
jgi:hypothetical protein